MAEDSLTAKRMALLQCDANGAPQCAWGVETRPDDISSVGVLASACHDEEDQSLGWEELRQRPPTMPWAQWFNEMTYQSGVYSHWILVDWADGDTLQDVLDDKTIEQSKAVPVRVVLSEPPDLNSLYITLDRYSYVHALVSIDKIKPETYYLQKEGWVSVPVNDGSLGSPAYMIGKSLVPVTPDAIPKQQLFLQSFHLGHRDDFAEFEISMDRNQQRAAGPSSNEVPM